MKPSRLPSSLCALLTTCALGVAPIACKKDDPAGPEAAGGEGEAGGEAKAEPAGDTPADDAPKGGEPTPEKRGGIAQAALEAAGVVTGPRTIEPHYPTKLDPLLDLVPADATSFFVVRDLPSLVDGGLGFVDAQRTALSALADEVAKEDPHEAEKLRETLDKTRDLATKIAASGIDLSLGVVFAKRPGEDNELMIYGATKVDALPALLTTLGATRDLPEDCAPVASAAGYAVCAEKAVASYAPGSKAADLRAKVQKALPGVDLERANVVGSFEPDPGEEPIGLVLETGQGMAHLAFAASEAREDLSRYLEPGEAPGLGLIGPGQPFVWARGSKAEIARAGSTAPAMATASVKAINGEFVAGGLGEVKGFAFLMGLDDPSPIAGLLSLASMGLSEIPKELPDGTKIDAKIETIAGTSALHLAFSGGKQAPIVKSLGYSSDLFAFAAGKYGAFTAGATSDVVEHVAKYAGTGPSAEMLAALPEPLAKAIEDKTPVLAAYVPFDALHSAQAIDTLETLTDQIPPGTMTSADPKALVRRALDVAAPLSSMAMWVTDVDTGPVFHFTVQGFADVGTAEGKAALAALDAVASGGDRKAIYEGLAAAHPTSPRAPSYKARAGQLGDPFGPIVAGSAILGGLGALLFIGSARTTKSAAPVEVAPATP